MTSNVQEITFEQGDPDALAFIDTSDIVNHLESLGYLVKDLSEWAKPANTKPLDKPVEAVIKIDHSSGSNLVEKLCDDVICWRYIE